MNDGDSTPRRILRGSCGIRGHDCRCLASSLLDIPGVVSRLDRESKWPPLSWLAVLIMVAVFLRACADMLASEALQGCSRHRGIRTVSPRSCRRDKEGQDR
jgi:hypothetical protein